MQISSSLLDVSAGYGTAGSSPKNAVDRNTFAAELTPNPPTAVKLPADFVSGRLGIDLDNRGQVAEVVYLNDQGQALRSSAFKAERILQYTEKYGIDLADLKGLGEQLDAAGIGYRPYELYPGTGSDHGIDFDDLLSGGLGTAYDWRVDEKAAQKGPGALERLAQSQAFAEDRGLVADPDVTHNRGIDPAYFATLASGDEEPRTQVAFNGATASWHHTYEEAAAVAATYGGAVVSVTATTPDTQVATPASSGTDESDVEQLLKQLQAVLSTGEPSQRQYMLDGLLAALDSNIGKS